MTHLGLFEGIGGFSLAARWMGWETKAWCEINPFCQTVLKHHFPEAERFTDIKQTDFTKYANTIDVLTGGFPCQPFSAAGKRGGKEDDRYLWPEAVRAIREIKPNWIVFENVAGLFTILEQQSLSEMEIQEIQLFSENKELEASQTIIRLQRRVIATIIEEIRAAGYVLPTLTDGTPILLCIPACAVNAPHRRDRIWFVAYANSDGRSKDTGRGYGTNELYGSEYVSSHLCETFTHAHSIGLKGWQAFEKGQQYDGRGNARSELKPLSSARDATNANSGGLQKSDASKLGKSESFKDGEQLCSVPEWSNFPTQPPVYSRNDGLSYRLDTTTISIAKWRTDSIKAYGNAIVPQVAFEIFKAIEKYENVSTGV